MHERALTSLAILKAQSDLGADYIENFVPFVVHCVQRAPSKQISVMAVQVAVRDQFGFQIPQSALNTILARAQRKGLVIKENGILVKADAAKEEDRFLAVQSAALRQLNGLIRKLMWFCSTKHGVVWSEEQAEASLIGYLEEHSVPVLKAAIEGVPIVASGAPMKNAHFLVNSFVHDLAVADDEGFKYLETIVKGRMLADVLSLPDINQVKRPFDKVKFFFDTGFLMKLLGVDGQSSAAPALELVEMLRAQKAQLCVFRDTLDETGAAIARIAKHMKLGPRERMPSRYAQSVQRCVDAGFRASDLELLVEEMPEIMIRYGISPMAKPPHEVSIGLDLNDFKSVLIDVVKYRRPKQHVHDMEVLAAIDRLRHGEVSQRLETTEALFVTCNSAVARASSKFFRERYQGVTVPHCIVDQYLTTVVWLKGEIKTSDLPRKQIIANAYAALNPPDELWRTFLVAIEVAKEKKEITEDQYFLLRGSQRILMEHTKGDYSAFTQGTWQEVLAKAEENIRNEAAVRLGEQHQAMLKQIEDDHNATVRSKDQQIKQAEQAFSLVSERLAAQQAEDRRVREATERELTDLHEQIAKQQRLVAEDAQRIGLWISRGALAVLVTVLIVVEVTGHFTALRHFIQGRVALGLHAIELVVAALTFIHIVCGHSAVDLAGMLHKAITPAVEKSLRRIRKIPKSPAAVGTTVDTTTKVDSHRTEAA